jgi:hypothetical protein
MNPKTFRDIEKILHIDEQPEEHLQYSLPRWYHNKRNTDFELFSVEDLCICLRQNLFLEYLMNYIIKTFEKDVFVGEKYDGEMLAAFLSVNMDYWTKHENESNYIKEIVKEKYDAMDEDVKKDAKQLIELLGRINK